MRNANRALRSLRLFALVLLGSVVGFYPASAQTGPGGVGTTASTSAPALWLEGDAEVFTDTGCTTAASASDAVACWGDRTGGSNDLTQGTAAARPTYQTGQLNGNPILRFDGTDDSLERILATAYNGNSTTFLVFQPNNINQADFSSVFSTGTTGGASGTWQFHLNGSSAFEFFSSNRFNAGTALAEFYLFAIRINGTSLDVFRGGSDVVTGGTLAADEAKNYTHYHVGRNRNGNNRMNADVAEVITYRNVLNTAERQLVENYLSAKYALPTVNDVYVGDTSVNGDYDFDAAGIGEEADGSNTSGNSAGLILSEGSGSLDVDEYVMAGHKLNSNGTTAADTPAGVEARWQRVWYVDKTGTVDVGMAFDFSDAGFGSTTPSGTSYALLYRQDDTFNFTDLGLTPSVSGDVVSFTVTDANLQDGQYTLGSTGGPLPVELTLFEAVADGETVLLEWETSSETSNAGFEVERRAADVWERLGFVEGHGTSAEPHRYQYRAEALEPGRHVFRLKQIDHDGAFVYSSEVEVSVALPEAYRLSSLAPNPFNPQAQFTLALQQAQHVQIGVYNALGQRVAMLHEGTLTADEEHRFTLEAGGLPSGVYLIRVVGDRFAASRRAVLLK